VLIDFHTHTRASDGVLDPDELLRKALDSGLEMLAITDHDTVRGYERAAACHLGGVRLVPGVEMSCLWSGMTIHILGLGIDCDHPATVKGMATMDDARRERGEMIAARLARKGMPGALDGALTLAGDSQLGRPHFAAWMVETGHVRDHNQAFDRYLGQGRVGDVKVCWPELAAVVRCITASGGIAVIAHPLKYRLTRTKLRRLIGDFMAAGRCAREVQSGRQSRDEVEHLSRLADEFGLEVSIGSDFHREAPYNAPLGVESSPFEHLPGVWRRWVG
jgi:predicted metal-dependent phosphoesterase TrpH